MDEGIHVVSQGLVPIWQKVSIAPLQKAQHVPHPSRTPYIVVVVYYRPTQFSALENFDVRTDGNLLMLHARSCLKDTRKGAVLKCLK